MVWTVKGVTEKVNKDKSFVPKPGVQKNNVFIAKSFGKLDFVYSVNHLIRLSQKKICCSYCGINDFIKKEYVDSWYGSYNVSNYKPTTPNQRGHKFRWVPKSG